jgi:hypothetical protein
MTGETSAGGSAGNISATGSFAILTQTVCAQAGSTITLKTIFGGTATADFYAFIRQVN